MSLIDLNTFRWQLRVRWGVLFVIMTSQSQVKYEESKESPPYYLFGNIFTREANGSPAWYSTAPLILNGWNNFCRRRWVLGRFVEEVSGILSGHVGETGQSQRWLKRLATLVSNSPRYERCQTAILRKAMHFNELLLFLLNIPEGKL